MLHTKATREAEMSFHVFVLFRKARDRGTITAKVFQLSTLQVGLTDYIHTSLKLSKEMLHQLPSPLAHSASLSNGNWGDKEAEA
jgi:hypothetical protein